MRTLLISPWRNTKLVCGDDVVTRLLLAHPPAGVAYESFAAGLEAGWLKRAATQRAWLASLLMHSRPPAGVSYEWNGLPPWPYRLLGKVLPARPDEDIQWLSANANAPGLDLVHAFAHPVHLGGKLARLPVVLSCGCGNSDLLRNYYGLSERESNGLMRRDRRLLNALGVRHDLYNVKNVKFVVVPSLYAKRLHLEAGVPEEKIRVVRLGFETPAHSLPRESDGTCRFTLVGHQFWRKGGTALLSAFGRLHRLYPEARLTIVSSVKPEELGVELNGIELIDSLPRETIYSSIYPNTDVFMLPSLAEGYGMAAVEAMSFGLPVIASNQGALPELVKEGETGLLARPGDADELFEAMSALMANAPLRRRLGMAGRRVFEAEHAFEVTNQALKRVYDEALD
jgi:glycosyltransferase involved in cell wall biosynthesis